SFGKLSENDIILISTDGLSDYLSDEEIKEILTKNIPHRKKLKELVELAMKNGSKDNITAIIVSGKEQ
ncbi:MAG: serine/threonine-protein phosphatase, partial [Oscillospiraceae bacterium]